MDYIILCCCTPRLAIGDPYDWWIEHHRHPKVRCHIPKIISIVPKIRQKIINSWHVAVEEIIEGDELDVCI